MKKLISSLFVVALVAFAWNSQAGKVEVASAKPELIMVKVHADWCGSCKALTPRLKALGKTLEDKAVLFVTLDYTDEQTSAQATMLAAGLGIRDAIAEHNSTGTVLLIDADTHKIAEKFSVSSNDEMILGKIKALL